MEADEWRQRRRSNPLLQQLWEYAQHEHRRAAPRTLSSTPYTSLSHSSSPSIADSLSLSPWSAHVTAFVDNGVSVSGGSDRRAMSHRSFDASLLSASAESSPASHNASPLQHASPAWRPLLSAQIHSPLLSDVAPPAASPLSPVSSFSPSSSVLSAPPPASGSAAMWRQLNAAHQSQVDELLRHSNGLSYAATSDVVLSQLSLLEMGRAMRVRRVIRQRVQSMQGEAHGRLLRRCWYGWMQHVWRRADAMKRADAWRYQRQARKMSELDRQCVRRWRAAVRDRRHGELLRELSATWLRRRCLHAWHSLLYVHHARLHLALMHRHALYRDRVWTMFAAWQAAARDNRRGRQRAQAVEQYIKQRLQARLRVTLRRWSGYVSLERHCRAAVHAAMVSGYKHVKAVRPLLLN